MARHLVGQKLPYPLLQSPDVTSEPGSYVCLDNTLHPSNKRLFLATAVKNVIHAFGIDWDGVDGTVKLRRIRPFWGRS